MPRFSSRCPHCGKFVMKNTKFCRKCGLELEFCVACHTLNPWFADFCHNCGNPMAFEPTEKVVYLEGQHLNPLDDALLAIIKLRDGAISISEVSAILGVSKENLTESIERLQHSRLIERSA